MLEKQLLKELQEYVNIHLTTFIYDISEPEINYSENQYHMEIEDFIKNKRKQTFAQVLFTFIDKKGYSDAEIYKKAGLDRRHFSKIRSNPEYRLGKNTAIALAFALELTKKEAEKLLSSAGFSLSDNDTFDLVIQFCLEKKIYDLHDVNQALNYFSLKPLLRVIE
ncbi:hypothetical protein AWH56_022645 [Anaerobacillus isosaccharinicus]|uniref:Appr-1-p processing protein n=1 Tax=Anaerobacillus isosaccharinicus TaxID=1532552 RepID=A0A1S2LES3_9BACI|nr:hypothetical protein [Anaerobacillus isosaccharinicus]MBA5586298.1 hypothetical protein [Anaerobacillus isosaccharinicus]QOY35452.1 hypothetical protein AWH56_022645 [Anaerobacillus isosaccharinicus]